MKRLVSKKQVAVIILLLMFIVIDNTSKTLNLIDGYSQINQWIKYTNGYLFQFGFCMLFTWFILLYKGSNQGIIDALGLNDKIRSGLFTSFVFTLPMLLGYSIIFQLNNEVTILDIIFWSFISGFVEEVIFRGFLFGMLFRVLRFGFLPSIVMVSLLFGMGHVYQGNDFSSIVGVFLITSIGSLLFGWLYIEWGNNLWVPIGVHILMNLYWSIFNVDATNALGGWGANVFRFSSLMLALVVTILRVRKKGSNLSGKLFALSY